MYLDYLSGMFLYLLALVSFIGVNQFFLGQFFRICGTLDPFIAYTRYKRMALA